MKIEFKNAKVDRKKLAEGDFLVCWDDGRDKVVRWIVGLDGNKYCACFTDGREAIRKGTLDEIIENYEKLYNNVIVVPADKVNISIDLGGIV